MGPGTTHLALSYEQTDALMPIRLGISSSPISEVRLYITERSPMKSAIALVVLACFVIYYVIWPALQASQHAIESAAKAFGG
jgi:hypothetical protein